MAALLINVAGFNDAEAARSTTFSHSSDVKVTSFLLALFVLFIMIPPCFDHGLRRSLKFKAWQTGLGFPCLRIFTPVKIGAPFQKNTGIFLCLLNSAF